MLHGSLIFREPFLVDFVPTIHNILWYAKKALGFSAKFSSPAPLSPGKSCAIMG